MDSSLVKWVPDDGIGRNVRNGLNFTERGFVHVSRAYEALEIMDRVGGGDSFASGLIYGFLTGKSPAQAVNFGTAHGALAMTTPGDTSMASRAEVKKLVKGGSARVIR